MSRRIVPLAFLGYTAVWTAILVVPDTSIFMPDDLPEELSRWEFPVDKLVHAGGYFGLTMLAITVVRRHASGVPLGWVFAGAILHGAATELAQSFAPERQANLADWSADLVGITAAMLVAAIIRRTHRVQHHET